MIKLGSDGFIAYATEEDEFVNRQHFPALCPNPVDVAGAGDSVLACMAVSLCAGNSTMISAALGACMASLAVQRVGNLPVGYQHLQQLLRNIAQSLSHQTKTEKQTMKTVLTGGAGFIGVI